jgi:DNA modification methylase
MLITPTLKFEPSLTPRKRMTANMNDLLQHNVGSNADPVECLGMNFPSQTARRQHFLNLLAQRLKDPEFRKIEGFPQGTDDAILALSDPPFYTACPNPFIEEFVRFYGSSYDSSVLYGKEPFATDVSEGKNDPIYNAHSYHTKVPHKAIMRYILHYTQPGDLIYDGFCGTGMTGVAAQMCGDRSVLQSMGFKIDPDGTISEKTDEDGRMVWKSFSKVGVRHAILNDLSPAATFIAYNYNTPSNAETFESEAKKILSLVESECAWMYQTLHFPTTDQLDSVLRVIDADNSPDLSLISQVGRINYTVWSDIFSCGECAGEVVFWDAAVDAKEGSVRDSFPCPHCSAVLTKRSMERSKYLRMDEEAAETVRQARQVPVLINYSIGTRRFEKRPDAADLCLIQKIDKSALDHWVPTDKLPDGFNTRQPIESHGTTRVHHFYTRRNLRVLSSLRHHLKSSSIEAQLLCLVGDQLPRASKMHKIAVSRLNTNLSKTAGILAGTLYIPSNQIEYSVLEMIGYRIKDVASYLSKRDSTTRQMVFTGSTSCTLMPDECLDYIFLDPPFGSNINYSELNFLWEAWLRVFTNNTFEAIENKIQKKSLNEYRRLMTQCFTESYKKLKPGRWMTVEFSNTQAAVWNTIQTALQEAGFIVANVSVLDKKQGTIKAVTTTTAVKQDLVISAYKPNGGLESRFSKSGGNDDSVWDFARTHLGYLPVVKFKEGQLGFISERDPRIIFDRMVAWFLRHNVPVPMSTQEFQAGLEQRFVPRDGMVFLPDQVAEYDKRRAQVPQAPQIEMFINDERSALDWLADFLKKRPSTYQELHPDFIGQLGAGWKKHETRPELSALLESSFLRYEGTGDVPSQIHGYLSTNHKDLRGLEKNDARLRAKAKDRWYVPDPNKAQDLEQKREKALLKEFEAYQSAPGRRLKEFRLEVLRVGFKTAWAAKNYKTIIAIAQKIPDEALQEDEKLLLWYDQALTRMEADA